MNRPRSDTCSAMLLCPAALLVLAGIAVAAEPATRPATQDAPPARKLIKVQLKGDAGKPDAVTVLLDTNDAPDLKDWASEVARRMFEWHPRISERLASEGFTPPREVTLRFAKIKAPGQATGATIEASIE